MRVGIFSLTGACIGSHDQAPVHMWVGDLAVEYAYPLTTCETCKSREQYDEGMCIEAGIRRLDDEEVLNRIFRALNRVDDGDHERMAAIGYLLPSLSVGDLVSFQGTTWRVDSVGFTKLTGERRGPITCSPHSSVDSH